MSIINYASREIQFKIVYYGPALCGKTTNLGYIHQRINPQNRGDLVSLATASDRTLFFDFLPLNALVIKGFVTKFQLYTVPGQVIYNATRQLVLRSVDGMVFVADSQWEKMEENVESFKNLEDNLAKQNTSLDDVPYVLQYNKRDLPPSTPFRRFCCTSLVSKVTPAAPPRREPPSRDSSTLYPSSSEASHERHSRPYHRRCGNARWRAGRLLKKGGG